MLQTLKTFYYRSGKLINWLLSPIVFGTTPAFVIFAFVFIILIITAQPRIYYLLGAFVFFAFFIVYFKKKQALLTTFSHKSFLFSVMFFSSYLSVCIIGVIFYLGQAIFNKDVITSSLLFNIFYIDTVIIGFLWFGYHIVKDIIELKRIKEYLMLYFAITVTISFGILWPLVETLFRTMVTSLGVSFVWVEYLIALKEK